jgi:hypothetical protein
LSADEICDVVCNLSAERSGVVAAIIVKVDLFDPSDYPRDTKSRTRSDHLKKAAQRRDAPLSPNQLLVQAIPATS